jgi:hemolysin III
MTAAPEPVEPEAEAKPRLRGVFHLHAFILFLVLGAGLVAGAPSGPGRAAVAVFGGCLALTFGVSALYHRLSWRPRARRLMRRLDHAAIYLLIAGTYTPFALGVLRGTWGWSLLIAVWTLAAVGIVLKSTRGFRYAWASTAVYLAMGWLIVIAMRPLVAHIGFGGIAWLLAGGLAYTGGVIFFAWDRLRYGHMIWHLFVLAGSICHFVAVLRYASA